MYTGQQVLDKTVLLWNMTPLYIGGSILEEAVVFPMVEAIGRRRKQYYENNRGAQIYLYDGQKFSGLLSHRFGLIFRNV
jgi:hypothetical protein